MSEPLSIPYIKTTPKPFGVTVEWEWPDGFMLLSSIELQYLCEDGRIGKERIHWPATSRCISGLKAGERLQVRLRIVAADGSARGWRAGDWVEGVSSVDAGEILQAVQDEIRSSEPFKLLHGECFIKEASLDAGKLSANYSVKVGTNHGGKQYAAGMGVDVENGQKKVVFKANRFKVQKATGGIIENATATTTTVKGVNNVSVDPQLSDWMQRAIIKAVRESDLFTSLQSGLNAQAASIAALQQATLDAATNVISNALKPGGAIWAYQRGR